MSRWLTRYRWTMVHAGRITAAGITAFISAYVLGLPEALWAVITAVIVTQSSIGGSLKTVLDQFMGSIFGAAFGVAVALTLMPETWLAKAVALVVALAPLSALAAFSPGLRVAPVTAAIILLSGIGFEAGPLGVAVSRIFGVGLGCTVGLLVSVLLLPFRASRSALETAAHIARLLAEQLDTLALGGSRCQTDLPSLAIRTREALNHLEVLVGEAARERWSWFGPAPGWEPLHRTLGRLRHDVGMLRRAAREAGHDTLDEDLVGHWITAAEAGATTLRTMSDALAGQQPSTDANAFAKAVRRYRSALDARRADETQPLSTAALGRLFGIGFILEQLRRNLDDLAERCREINAARGSAPVPHSPAPAGPATA